MAYTGRAAGRAQSVQRLSDPVGISLTGDANGSIELDGSQDVSISVSVADDSHNHVIGNVDGLQDALDAKLASSSYIASDVLTKIKTVDGSGSGLDADTVDGQHASDFAAASHSHNYAGSSSAGGVANDSNSVIYTGYGNGEFTAVQTSDNWQTWTGGWATHLIGNHGDGSSYYNQTIIMPFWGPPEYMRKQGGSNNGPYKFWTEENSYACRAWVNFNGTGTVAIRASGNVSSITDYGTGAYGVNFSTAMPTASYSGAGLCLGTTNGGNLEIVTVATTSMRVQAVAADTDGSHTSYDPSYVTLNIIN